ncbi:MAG: ornithine cyclodeaminase family protein [Aminobacterium sp.]|jgi:ornithine cyclodeaminase/alanine dehydrogenase|uniref:ornithine cyclodeaminase family protein n=1 Tax=Aminobacterium sp. TaxID=1872491 RepID=UPI001BD00716|nr:ornithine cyclodeaminase family protein [Aminobacterium sp.]MEA4877573.1 ornithine cyclodeaminase family protein [Aminobacterium sp.]
MKKVNFRYLSQEDVMGLGLDYKTIIDVVETALVAHGNKEIEMPPKPGVHTRPSCFIHAMPAWVKDQDICGLKWVSGYPENYKHDLPHIAGLQIMNDAKTGMPLCIMDCRWITAVRTAAVTAITAKYCARKDSKTLTVLGTGVQGRFNAIMIKEVLPGLEKIYAYDKFEESVEAYKRDISTFLNVEVEKAEDLESAIRDSDLVLTAGVEVPTIRFDWLKEGFLGFGLEAARAWYGDVIEGIDKFITDDIGQTTYWYENMQGAFHAKPTIYGELGEVVTGRKKGRENDSERILAINIGMAIEDMVLGQKVYEEAEKKNIGVVLSLMEKARLF